MSINSTRYWVGVLYPENMRPNWEAEIGDIVQVPYAYCVHQASKDSKSEHRKEHVHLILAFSNTTTRNHAFNVFELLSADGKRSLNTIQAVISIRNAYDYLIHDTDSCRKLGKELYPREARIEGNNFDIGAFEQIGLVERNEICMELCNSIINEGFTNFADFYIHVLGAYEDNSHYFEVLRSHSGLFERLTKANYQKRVDSVAGGCSATRFGCYGCCPDCGSVDVKKNGKTARGLQKWQCKDCGKSFI